MERKDLLYLGAFALVLFLFGNWLMPVTDPVESNYVETAKEMIAAGDYLSPRIFGNYWYDKPILFYWELIAAFQLFGMSDFAARLFPALFAVIGVLMTYGFGTKLYGRCAGIFSAVILALSVEYWYLAHAIITDMTLWVTVSLTLMSFYHGYETGKGRYYYLAFAAAAAAVLTVHGVGVHPGSAKNVMVNAATVAMDFHALLPEDEVPEKTEGYEGFFHLTDMEGGMAKATLRYIIRDHDREKFEEKKALFAACAEKINEVYGDGTAEVDITDSYYNMKEKILPHFHLIERAENAFRANGVAPMCVPIRGGTDGANLSWAGLPCPNLSTGGYNYHGVREWIPSASLDIMTNVVVTLTASFAE